MDKTEINKAKKYFETIKTHESFGIDEDFDRFKERIVKAGPFLVCKKILHNLFGDPKTELKPKYQEIIRTIQKEQ
jgi:hypothetical protein